MTNEYQKYSRDNCSKTHTWENLGYLHFYSLCVHKDIYNILSYYFKTEKSFYRFKIFWLKSKGISTSNISFKTNVFLCGPLTFCSLINWKFQKLLNNVIIQSQNNLHHADVYLSQLKQNQLKVTCLVTLRYRKYFTKP